MADASSNVAQWKRQLAAELKRDKKKSAVLAGVALVAAVMGARAVLKTSPPSPAGAAVTAQPPEAPAELARFLEASWRTARAEQDGAPAPAPRDRRPISRDLFAVRWEAFPLDAEAAPVTKAAASAPAADPRQAEEMAIRAEARSLALQSTVISARPTAIINGQVLAVGDWINGFQLLEIAARSCTVAKGNLRIQLEMTE